MKKKLLFLCFFCTLYSVAQNVTNSNDHFTYEKVEVTKVFKEEIPLKGDVELNISSLSQDNSEAPSASSTYDGSNETIGNLSVSLTGGALYEVPIDVPPGINGIKPTISLNYNSQSGNGLAGYGWNLGGISVITRIPATKYYDGVIDPVDFDNLDRFALDGERLVLKSGTYGSSGATYETTTKSNLKIVSFGISPFGANYGPQYFIVYYPDGSHAYFGNTSDSNSRMDYAISYWENPQGIHISYAYTLSDNTLSISSIKYGSRGSNPAINEIVFGYGPRNRNEQSYVGNISFLRKNILKKISVNGSGGVRYKEYVITHNKSYKLGYDQIGKIQEFDHNGNFSDYPRPITFSYFSNENQRVPHTGIEIGLGNLSQTNAAAFSLDLSGDGLMDIVAYPKTKDKFWVLKDLQKGSINYPVTVNSGKFEDIFPVTWLTHNNKIIAGQGISVVQSTTNNRVKFLVYSNGTTNPIYYQYEKLWSVPTYSSTSSCGATGIISKIPQKYLSGDFDGDGLTDVLAIGKPYSYSACVQALEPCGPLRPQPLSINSSDVQKINDSLFGPQTEASQEVIRDLDCCQCDSRTNNISRVNLINLDRRVTSNFVKQAGYLNLPLASDHQLFAADFDGDGKSDIFQITNGRIYVYSINNSGNLQLLSNFPDSRIKANLPVLPGDYNGDGKTDFIIPTAVESDVFAVFMATGTSFIKNEQKLPFYYKNFTSSGKTLYGYNLIAVDINGDGRTDILDYRTTTYTNSTEGSQTIWVYNNMRNASASMFSSGSIASSTGKLQHYPIPVFLTSDQPNNNLSFASISSNHVSNFTFPLDHNEEVLIKKVNNHGVDYKIEYNNLNLNEEGSDYTPVYQYTSLHSYPNVDIELAPGYKVVTAITRDYPYATSPAVKQIYSYYGAVNNMEGQGFLGFQGIAKSNWHTNSSDRIYEISLFDPLKGGAIKSKYTKPITFSFNSNSGFITNTNYSYFPEVKDLNKSYTLNLQSLVTTSKLEGTVMTTNYTYDLFNNPKQIRTTYGGDGSKTLDFTYYDNVGSPYVIGRINTVKESSTMGTTFTKEEQFIYTGSLVTQKKTKGNGTQFNIENFTHDASGNILTKSSIPYNNPPRIEKYEYDISDRFLIKYTDHQNRDFHFVHDPVTGKVLSEKNSFDQTTTYKYDDYHRLTLITDHTGKKLSTTYTKSSNVSYTVTDLSDDGSSTIRKYDPLKRLVLFQKKNELGQWVKKSFEYDKFDRLYKESEPYMGTSASQWNVSEYDLYGRLKKFTSFNGKVTTFSYDLQSITVSDLTKSVTTVKDAFGNVKSVKDPGGTINYTYYGNGQMKTADVGGIVTSIEIDGWGNKTKLSDPSAGVYTYQYNGFGELTKETGPKGVTEFKYANNGILNQKIISGDLASMTINYTYGSNRLLSSIAMTSSDKYNKNGTYIYTYETSPGQTDRLKSIQENSNNIIFLTNYTYDNFGRIETEENKATAYNKTSGKKIKYTYQNGAVIGITDFLSNEALWSLDGLNARGQSTSVLLGNTLNTINTFDSFGNFTSSKLVKGGSTNTQLMQLVYNFDVQNGTLTSRTNSLFNNWTENFVYDSSNRLISYSDNNGTKTQNYDSKGRISNSSSIGNYIYGTSSYQHNQLNLNALGESYYNNLQKQTISFNAFKSPGEIIEEGKDKVSFEYNAFEERSSIYFGSLEPDKLQRKNRRHYSQNGRMEVTYDKQINKVTFVTYLGGDAYNAPMIWHSENSSTTTNNLLYLHRDYLGSIIAITDKNGIFKEKRHFDAWGNIVKLQDGNSNNLSGFKIFDRGFTGHEHLLGVGIIHMNGRIYDPTLHKFLSPDNYIQDPFNTQNFNRYSYVLNNPLMYIDPTGEKGEKGGFFAALFWIAQSIWGTHPSPANSNSYLPNSTQNNSSNTTVNMVRGERAANYHLDLPNGITTGTLATNFQSSSTSSSLTPNKSWLAPLQTGLDVVGLVPVVGEVADGANALIYLAQGDYVNAGLSGAAMIPLAGWGATGTKLAIKGKNAFDLADAAQGSSKLLTKGVKALHKHHVFPQQYRKWFASRGINDIDNFAVEISQSTHLKGIHGGGLGKLPGKWNQHWSDFIKAKPNASPSEIFHHGEGLLRRYGLEHLPYVSY